MSVQGAERVCSRKGRVRPEVIVVYGPPCSGKTTYVADNAKSGDTVIDLDSIARGLGSPVRWMDPDPWLADAQDEVERLIDNIDPAVTTWLIRSLPRQDQRDDLADRLPGAEFVLIDPGEKTCLARAKRDGRPSGTTKAIRLWYWRHER